MTSGGRLPPFFFIVTFWGRRHREWFLKFALPSLLASNNIPALQHPSECRFLICTTAEDWNALEREPIFLLLKTYVRPVFLESPARPKGEHKYVRMSKGHEVLTTACYEAKACGIYIASDTVVPDGCVAEAQKLIGSGKHVILCSAIRFDLEGIERELVSRGLLKAGQSLVLSRRDAVALGLQHMHSESKAGGWEAENFGALSKEHRKKNFPVCCFWEVPGENGIVIHTHNWAPFAINFNALSHHHTESFKNWAIDGDYIYRNFRKSRVGEEVCVIDDSDKIILIGLTPHDEMVPPARARLFKSFRIVEEWVKGYMINRVVFDSYTDPLRRTIYSIPVRWHTNDLSSAWTVVEAQSHRVMTAYARYDLSFHQLVKNAHVRQDDGHVDRGSRMINILWSLLINCLLARPPMFIVRSWNWLFSYGSVIYLAIKGDVGEQERIRKRIQIIMSTFRETVRR